MDQPTQISTSTNGTPADSISNFGLRQAFSADGSKFVFTSLADNLVAGDTNNAVDIFIKDMATGVVTRVPTSTSQQLGTDTTDVSISADGTKIVFASRVDNLVPGDTDGKTDIFVKDLVTGGVTRVSDTFNGAPADSYNPTFSPDGSKVLFVTSTIVNSVPQSEIYMKDLATGDVTLISPSISGPSGTRGSSGSPVFSPDGTKIAFLSSDSDLVSGDTNGFTDFFVKDLVSGQVTRVSTDAGGHQVSNPSGGFAYTSPSFSPDGTQLLFATSLTMITGQEHPTGAIYLKNLNTNEVQLIAAVDSYAVFSPDGENVLYMSSASDLPSDAGDNPNHYASAIYVKNIGSGDVTRVAYTHGDGDPVFSPDGGKIVFESTDSSGRVEIYSVPFEVAAHATDDSYKGGYDAPLSVTVADGVLANDHDANGDAMTAALVSGTAHGTLKLKADGSFVYTPSGTYIGADTFTYHTFDGTKYSKDATVTINVTGNVERVDTGSDGSQASHGADVGTALFSPDGKYVLFNTGSSDLVPGDGDHYSQLMLKNLATGALMLVTDTASGRYNDHAQFPAFSPDGTRIAFASSSYGSTSGSDIVIKTLATGAFTVVSTSAEGVEGNSISAVPQFSPDGTKIVFYSLSNNLVSGDTNDQADIFVKDLNTGAITLVSTAADGTQSNDYSALPVFSPDGKSIVFSSAANNLVAGDTNGATDIFMKNLATGAITLLSTNADGAIGDGNSDAPVFSPDGKMVAFTSAARNLVAGDTNNIEDIFVKNLETGQITLVSSNAAGEEAIAPGSTGAEYPVFSPDGTRIAFTSQATNLVAGATNTNGSIFEKNLITGAVRLISSDSFEVDGNNFSTRPSYSPDGKKIVFYSRDNTLVPGDTNNVGDIFVKDLTKFPIGSGHGNTAPVANADSYTMVEGDALHVAKSKGVLANDTDAQNDTLTAALVKGPAHGELTLNVNGSFDYAPDAGYSGKDTFTYRASDGTDSSSNIKVTLTVTIDPTLRSSVTATLEAYHQNLILTGKKAIDGTGNSRDNDIAGNGAANVLDGMLGKDTLTGGGGHDTFVFDTKLKAANVDTITDFKHSADTFDLDHDVFAGLKAGTLASGAFKIVSNATSTTGVDGSDRILYDKVHGDLYFDQDGSGSRHDRVLFAHVTDKLTLDHTDFHIV